MRHKHLAIALVMLVGLLVFSLSIMAQEAFTPGETVEGALDGEALVYSLDATRGQLVVVSMVSEEFDNQVTIQQDGNDLASDDDSGGDLNALLAYVVQEDGSFDVVAGASFFSDAAGPFTLTIDVLDPPVVALGESVTLEPAADGSPELYAVVEAAAGDVVNVWATNTAEDEDVRVALVGVDAAEIDEDDDDGPGENALIRRVVLPTDGLYLIKVSAGFFDELVLQPVEITVEATESLFLSAEPQELVLGDGAAGKGTEVYTVEMTAGTTYRFIVTVEPIDDEIIGINMVLLDTDKFFDPEVDVQHGTGVTWDYLATSNGTARLDVHPSFFGTDIDTIEYTIALEVIE